MNDYERQAAALFDALKAGDERAEWRFKWEHPRFRGKMVEDVRAATLEFADAQLVVAREHAFDDWAHLTAFVNDGGDARFESAVDAVVSGDVATLRSMLRETPELARARSTRRHHATLLHYLGANGVEGWRQKTPPNAIEVAKLLLDAGAEVDATADLYDEKCTTLSMLVSSCHPAEAGLQAALAETLLDRGAAIEGVLMTALIFGYCDTAEALVRRGAPVRDLATAAGLGRIDDAAKLLPSAGAQQRHMALALAAQLGRVAVVQLLLDAGEDPNRRNPDGFHSHATPLHQAVWSNHAGVVRLLVERGARLDIKDTIYQGTPLDWAVYGERHEIAEFLRGQCGSPKT